MKSSNSWRCRRSVAPILVAVVLGSASIGLCSFETRSDQDPPVRPTVTFEAIVAKARELAGRGFREPVGALPEALDGLTYDEYRDIRFRPEAALFRGDPSGFEVQLFHCGYLFRSPVSVNIVSEGTVRTVPYRASDFDFGPRVDLGIEPLPADLGFAGLRVHVALNRPDYKDELVAFLGASYFRMLSRGQVYGISARGLAIDTGEPQGEEFPAFREFWIEPLADAAIRVHALLDSRRVTGAYEFTFRPGAPSSARVLVSLFARAKVEKLGIAPMTSMFLFGEDRVRKFSDYRPEVHDSDLLLVRNGESAWTSRPLTNPNRVHRVSRFDGSSLAGFGLLQRDREFANYQDLESRFELRPSLWVTPIAGFDDGFVELVEIPTIEEIHDNVVAYYVPKGAFEPGTQRDFEYVLEAPSGEPDPGEVRGRVRSTRVHSRPRNEGSLFVVDFEPIDASSDAELPSARVVASDGDVSNVVVVRNEVTGGTRVSFEWRGDVERVELSLTLKRGTGPCGERWHYVYEIP